MCLTSLRVRRTWQAETYNAAVRPLVESCFEGINVTIMAYGQTGSGKTYTMGSVSLEAVDTEPGIIPQFVSDVFQRIMSETSKVCVGGGGVCTHACGWWWVPQCALRPFPFPGCTAVSCRPIPVSTHSIICAVALVDVT